MSFLCGHLVIMSLSAVTLCGDTFDLRWPTTHNAKPPEADLAPAQAQWLPAFRASLEWLPESTIITLALSQSQVLGVPPETGARIAPLIAARYEAIALNPEFTAAPSHLPYCYSPTRPAEGLARVTTPAADKIATAPVIVFIHGQGGSFLWYQQWLKTTLPDHVIISPACGANPAFVSATYIEESVVAAEKHLGHAIPEPILVGLSAGGFAAQRVAAGTAARWQKVIVLGAYRAPDVSPHRWRGHAVDFIVGADEYFVRDGTLARDVATLRRYGARVGGVSIPGADHFFALTHPAETEEALRRALSWFRPPTL
jgi:pimeloyl-ACP methyl ester carboxylesterase